MYEPEPTPNDCEFWEHDEETVWNDDVNVGYAVFCKSTADIVSVHRDGNAAKEFVAQTGISRDYTLRMVPLFPTTDDVEYPNLP